MVKHQNMAVLIRRTARLLLRGATYIALCAAITGCAPTATAGLIVSPSPMDHQSQAAITVVNLADGTLRQVPVTFGEPFRSGDIPQGNTVVAYLDGKALSTQADIKARNPDGSVRHAILTVVLPVLAGRASAPLNLRPVADTGGKRRSLSLEDLLRSGFDAAADITISGQHWHLDARALLQHTALTRSCVPYGRECSQWLSGPLVSEWVVGGPVLSQQGMPHSHIAVYFAVRAYGPAPVTRVRVDVIVENDWAYARDPQNLTYDAKIEVAGQSPYTINHLEHYRQARWHKAFWWGKPDPLYARQDSRYLQATLAVPRYEPVKLSEKIFREATQRIRKNCGPMQRCDQTKDMSNVGAQPAIGPLPRWTSAYVVDPAHQTYAWMLANSDALGSYGVHYRDQLSGQPLSVEGHPCATLVEPAEVSHCPVSPHANDNFPRCKAQCKSPLSANEAHHPSPAYVAYLVTGDWYYLEELKFWADWVVFQQNPAYRHYANGLLYSYTLRGQGWALRTLGYAAFILPDNDPFKNYLNRVVENNIHWYNQNYTDSPSANALHVITNGYAVGYPNHGNPETGVATWQESFFTWSVGNLRDLGFRGADKLLNWVAAFQVNLMTSPDFCWIMASAYELQVRDTKESPFYDSLRNVYSSTFPEMRGVACNSSKMAAALSKPRGYKYARNVMVGYPQSATGFPANFQIGLAAAAGSDVPGARKAWALFDSRTIKPDYEVSPQFAIIPRYVSK